MKFSRLHDPLMTVLFEDDDIVAVDKPYGIDSHTNEAKEGQADLVIPGLIEVFEKQLARELHIVHRLDRTTTGVIVFAKTAEGAKKYRDFFRGREAKKTYLFVTDRKSSATELECATPIVHKGSTLEATTHFTRLERSARFELWQARPLTGRNHQIRIHAAELSLSLLGDEKYGGTSFPFLCLHDQKIEFSNGVSIESPQPIYFDELTLLEDTELAKTLFEIDRRRRLFGASVLESDQCFRLMSARRESGERVATLEQFGDSLFLYWFRDDWGDGEKERFRRLSKILRKPIFVRLMNSKDPSVKIQKIADAETPETWTASEGEIKFELDLDSAQAPGLYLDLRLQRNWIRQHSKDKAVLHLFAHTCGVAVAAALDGASEVQSVDTNKTVLNRGRRNFEVSGVSLTSVKFLGREGLSYLEQCQTKGSKFDLIVCSPPAFWRGDKGSFKIEKSLEALLKGCLVCLKPGGAVLFSTTSDAIYVDDLRKAILKVQHELGLTGLELESIQPSLDFELPGERPTVKSMLIRLS